MNSTFVADASITLAWCFLEEATPLATLDGPLRKAANKAGVTLLGK